MAAHEARSDETEDDDMATRKTYAVAWQQGKNHTRVQVTNRAEANAIFELAMGNKSVEHVWMTMTERGPEAGPFGFEVTTERFATWQLDEKFSLDLREHFG